MHYQHMPKQWRFTSQTSFPLPPTLNAVMEHPDLLSAIASQQQVAERRTWIPDAISTGWRRLATTTHVLGAEHGEAVTGAIAPATSLGTCVPAVETMLAGTNCSPAAVVVSVEEPASPALLVVGSG